MGYAALFIVMFFVAVLLAASGVRGEDSNLRKRTANTTKVSKSDSMKRSQVRERLLKLSKSVAPEKLSMGAMCYDMVGPPGRVEYVCPKCGEKTLYASKKSDDNTRHYARTDFLEWELPACRKMVKQIKGLDVRLDESQFCAKCSLNAKNPKLVLLVHYADKDEPHRVEGINADDLRLIQEFLSGKEKHVGKQDLESPLKNYLKRLEELLGVKPEISNKDE